MLIYMLQNKHVTFEELLGYMPNRPEPIGDGELEKYPNHRQTIRDVATYIIEEYDADFEAYARDKRTFDDRQVGITKNWDYSLFNPLYLTKARAGYYIRDGRHRSIILAVFVLTDQVEFQPVPVEITDYDELVKDCSDYTAFLRDWTLRFIKDETYRANLSIQFEREELQDRSLAVTLEAYKSTTEAMLDKCDADVRARIAPFVIRGNCHYGVHDFLREVNLSGKVEVC